MRRLAPQFATITVATVLVLAGATTSGGQAPSAGGAHLMTVPTTPEGTAALERSTARVVARYAAFTLVEATGGDVDRLRRAGADRRDDMREVRLARGTIDPNRERRSLAGKGRAARGGLALVQFVGPVKERWLELLRGAGVRVVGYQAQNAYLVHGGARELDAVAELVGSDPAVRAAVPVQPADKAEGNVLEPGPRRVAIQTIAGDVGAEARERADGAGRTLRGESGVPGLRTQYLEIDGSEAAALARDAGVVAIEPYVEPRLLDERAAQIVAANLSGGSPVGPGYLTFLSGEGFPATTFNFSIDVTDEGLDTGSATPGHPDFFEDGDTANPDRVTYASDFTSDPDAKDCGGHGTNVASIAAGYNDGTGSSGTTAVEDASAFNYGLGIAPRAAIGASKVFRCNNVFDLVGGATLTTLTSSAYVGGARISNNSWGSSDFGEYSVDSQTYDSLVRDAQPGTAGNQQMVEVFAAGNDGDRGYNSVGSPGTGKNVISVGASESVRPIGFTDGCGVADSGADDARDIIDFSSRGPTDDGRRKPDLVAPGSHVTGASPQHPAYLADGDGTCDPQYPLGNVRYSLVSGTSQATPEVAGAAALVRDWYAREHGAVPSPALTKAILVNAATDLAGGDNGKGGTIGPVPNADQGWGRVDMGEVLDATPRVFRDQADLLGASGASVTRGYSVQDSAKPVKVTLAFTDRFGPTTGSAFVNDLDLVVDAGGRTYKGNVLSDGLSITGGSADPRNNVESVYLPAGTSGSFSVRVVGTTVAGDGVPSVGDSTDQDFGLVVSNAAQVASPVLSHDATTLAGGDGDGVLEPDESFTLQERVRNAGDAGATGVTGTLSPVSADVSVTQASSAYPSVAAGATGTNATPFEGTLGPGATCGADAEMALSLATDQGTQAVPVTVPTGGVGPVASFTSSSSAPIPDDDAGGVDSTLTVPTLGRVKDLNVRIESLSHSFVGDLKLELIGPDGTTVTLAEHPGGPDNGGNDFQDTVFDDEAATGIGTGSAPYSGSFKPQADQLARFDGKQSQGTWTLRVRDLFDGDEGTLDGWGLDLRRAACGDVDPPETTITSGPSGTVSSRSASFGFGADEAASFECRLDGGSFGSCTSPKGYTGLADGAHTFAVRATDAASNVDPSPATRSWTVDTGAPALSLTSPRNGATTTDTTPSLAGTAGTAAGDSSFVTVKVWSGTGTAGSPLQTRTAMRAAGGTYSTTALTLAEGTYTARAEQADAVGNRGFSGPVNFRVEIPAPPPLGWAIRPRELDLSRALSVGVPVLAACGTSCTASRTLRVSDSTARRLGLTTSSVGVGSATSSFGPGGRNLAVRLSRRARARMQPFRTVGLTVGIRIRSGSRLLSPARRGLALRRHTLGRAAAFGLRTWLTCSEGCSGIARFYISTRQARALGLSAPGGRRRAGSGSARLGGLGSARLTVRLTRSVRGRLDRVRSLRGTLRVLVRDASGVARRAAYRVTLRR